MMTQMFFEIVNCQQIKCPAENLYIKIEKPGLVLCHSNTTAWLVSCHTLSCNVCTSFPADLPPVHVPGYLSLGVTHDYSSMEVINHHSQPKGPVQICCFHEEFILLWYSWNSMPSLTFEHMYTCANIQGWIYSDSLLLFHSLLFPYCPRCWAENCAATSMQCFQSFYNELAARKDSLENTHWKPERPSVIDYIWNVPLLRSDVNTDELSCWTS